MSYEFDYDFGHIFTCDECGEEGDRGTLWDKEEAIRELETEGWQIDDRRSLCPACSNDDDDDDDDEDDDE